MNLFKFKRPFGRGAGFTLVEMLVVIFILVLLVGLIVGVSRWISQDSWKKQTIAWQGTIMDAVETYYQVKHVYPHEMQLEEIGYRPPPNPDTQPSAPHPWMEGSATPEKDDLIGWRVYCRGHNLYVQLMAVPQSAAKLMLLPSDAISKTSRLFVDPAAPKDVSKYFSKPVDVFCDALGNNMDYRERAGIGGRPVIISPGPDGNFGNSDNGWNAQFLKDNVRSDGQ
jgi:prepilin-type N-terminal cleavage/methylation domain-containing protein